MLLPALGLGFDVAGGDIVQYADAHVVADLFKTATLGAGTASGQATTDATGGDLRDYLAWVRLQGSESARVAEAILPETDADAIRIRTRGYPEAINSSMGT